MAHSCLVTIQSINDSPSIYAKVCVVSRYHHSLHSVCSFPLSPFTPLNSRQELPGERSQLQFSFRPVRLTNPPASPTATQPVPIRIQPAFILVPMLLLGDKLDMQATVRTGARHDRFVYEALQQGWTWNHNFDGRERYNHKARAYHSKLTVVDRTIPAVS